MCTMSNRITGMGATALFNFEWSELFDPVPSPFEFIVRGTLIYWFVLVILRFVLRRDTASARTTIFRDDAVGSDR